MSSRPENSEVRDEAFNRWMEVDGQRCLGIYHDRLRSLAMAAFRVGWQMRAEADERPPVRQWNGGRWGGDDAFDDGWVGPGGSFPY
jgi:hypothetical protein